MAKVFPLMRTEKEVETLISLTVTSFYLQMFKKILSPFSFSEVLDCASHPNHMSSLWKYQFPGSTLDQ